MTTQHEQQDKESEWLLPGLGGAVVLVGLAVVAGLVLAAAIWSAGGAP